MALIPATLAAGRWQTLTLAEQLGNIGSELARLAAARQRPDPASADAAAARLFALLDLTLADPRWRRRLKELTRLREVIGDCAVGGSAFGVDAVTLGAYLLPFALAARHHPYPFSPPRSSPPSATLRTNSYE